MKKLWQQWKYLKIYWTSWKDSADTEKFSSMSRFAQKSSDNAEKIIFILISEINKSEKLSFRKMMKFYFLFKICNSSSKTFTLSWINLSSWLWRNWVWWHNQCFLISAAWKASNKHCFSSEKMICSFLIFSWILSNHTTFTIRESENSKHNFFK